MNENVIKVDTQLGILRPVSDVFDAIVNPHKMCAYFTTTATGLMGPGKTITWTWDDYEAVHDIRVQKVKRDSFISFNWSASGVETLVEIFLESKGDNSTLVKITEREWPADYKGASQCMKQTGGWTHFLCCLKAYVEYNINLREGGVIK